MKRTTIFVPEDLERDLQLYASRDGRPAASLVREALAEYIAHRRDAHVLPAFAGQFASGRTDTAERHDALLFKTLAPHDNEAPKATRPRTPARARKPVRVRKPAARRR
jgi:predicted transcriptional regulator